MWPSRAAGVCQQTQPLNAGSETFLRHCSRSVRVFEEVHGQTDQRSKRDQGKHNSRDDSRRGGAHGQEFIVCLYTEQRKFQWPTVRSFLVESHLDRVIVVWTLLATLGRVR
jgi:hypothetical protein